MKTKLSSPTPRFGWVPDIPDQRDHIYGAPLEWLAKLPPKADLRPKCPPVYDQGQLGSCVANAVAGAIVFEEKRTLSPGSCFLPAFSSTLTGGPSKGRSDPIQGCKCATVSKR